MKKILVISEQPKNLKFNRAEKDALNLNIARCRGSRECWGSVPGKLKPYGLQENFIIADDNRSQFLATMRFIFGYFHERDFNYYWTHYIKCPGDFKKEKKNLPNDFESNACADKWLVKEIKKYDPDFIVAFGVFAGSYLLGKPIYRIKALAGKPGLRYKFNYNKKLIIFPHPAGGNVTFNEWRKNNHSKLKESLDRLLG